MIRRLLPVALLLMASAALGQQLPPADLSFAIIADQVTRDRKGYPNDWPGWATSEVGQRIAFGVMERLDEE